jgi:hypothetical protein
MNLLETIIDIVLNDQAEQIIVCTVDDRKHTQTLGKYYLPTDTVTYHRELERYNNKAVDKVVDDNRNLNTKRIYLKAERGVRV